jgi:hypothetical protein
MSDKREFATMSEYVDWLVKVRREGPHDSPPAQTANERAAQERIAKAHRLDNMESAAERKAFAARWRQVKQATLGTIAGSLRHGQVTSGRDRQRIADAIIRDLGDVTESDCRAIRLLVNTAAEAYAEGRAGDAWVACEDVSEALASGSSTFERDETPDDEMLDRLTPRQLADRIMPRP